MKIIALVPAHNEAESIAATIGSLLAQTHVPEEIIVVADNCTTPPRRSHEGIRSPYLRPRPRLEVTDTTMTRHYHDDPRRPRHVP